MECPGKHINRMLQKTLLTADSNKRGARLFEKLRWLASHLTEMSISKP